MGPLQRKIELWWAADVGYSVARNRERGSRRRGRFEGRSARQTQAERRGFETGEKRLEAQLFAEPEEWHRWVLSYEILNDDGSRADFRKLEKSFLTDVDHVLHNQTRVIVSNYVLARIFRCEYLSDGKWQTIGGPYPSPVNPELPGIRGWKRTYTSPPVTQILTQQPAVLTKVSA